MKVWIGRLALLVVAVALMVPAAATARAPAATVLLGAAKAAAAGAAKTDDTDISEDTLDQGLTAVVFVVAVIGAGIWVVNYFWGKNSEGPRA